MKIVEEYEKICLVEKKSDNTAGELKDAFSGRKICVCDFYVAYSERGEITESGAINYDGLLIIDHHAPVPAMMKHVSSTTFASKYVAQYGPLDDRYVVVINHTDTDSILSALIMSGLLAPHEEYIAAAIAADHTGAANVISDLLQSLEDDSDLRKSVDILCKVLEKRLWVRRDLQEKKDEFKIDGSIAYKLLAGKIDAGLLPCLFPEAEVIAVAWPMPKGSKRKWGIKVRLGMGADGIALNKLDLPDAGGRWNAISTTRQGGSDIELAEYVKIVRAKIDQTKQERGG